MGTSFAQDEFEEIRRQMVEGQIISRGITDPATLDAMFKVPRHEFVPANAKRYAYRDGPLSIGAGQTISQPYIVAFMTEELQLKPQHKVLEIGTGSGYQAAVLAEIVEQVYTIEIVESLGRRAENTLKQLEYDGVHVRIGDGYVGWPEEAPFDAIIVTARVKEIPQPLLDQLAEGGRMIIPVGKSNWNAQLVLVRKNNGKIKKKKRMAVSFVPFTRKQ
ncbi:MAG: protein-L-isoaspartate(D-aspartate) O-methyltransferase [Flavobacteriaceae bacterium]|nr:protein-L-isoaspartate(D-aspartate) O-methyltransferase [Flavobacteriaceae bacterium]